MEYLRKYNTKLVLAVILLIIIFYAVNIMDIDFYIFNWLENGVFNLLAPFFNVLESGYMGVNNFIASFFQSQELIEENERLREEVAELSATNSMLQEVEKQNQRLRELLAYDQQIHRELEVITGRVVGYSPGSWQRKIMVNVGRNDGVSVNMPVIGYEGNLIGRIGEAGMNSSQAILLNDPEFVVGGQVSRDDSRVLGLIKGLPESEGKVIMENIPWDADIREGDEIITSGVSDNYPVGLPIGKVVEVSVGKQGLSQVAHVETFGGERNLEEAVIVKSW